MDERELYYEMDTRTHQQLVAALLLDVAQRFIERAINHDASKFSDAEKPFYVDPVYELNTQEVPYGSDKYIELTKMMGDGWKHHASVNDHHPEYWGDMSKANLFAIIEMLCDWVAASMRRGNNPNVPLDRTVIKYELGDMLAKIMQNTLDIIA